MNKYQIFDTFALFFNLPLFDCNHNDQKPKSVPLWFMITVTIS